EAGIRQFLDVGTGLPTVDNTHQIAQRVAPISRVVYVDNDPLVLVHARALLTGSPEGATDYVDADLHQPELILDATAKTLDLDQPVALILSGILGHVSDLGEARDIVSRLMAGLPSGSYLSINDGTQVVAGEALAEAQQDYNDTGAVPYQLRTPEEIASFFAGLELIEPGIVSCPRWRPGPDEEPFDVDAFGGVGRKPSLAALYGHAWDMLRLTPRRTSRGIRSDDGANRRRAPSAPDPDVMLVLLAVL
ncbi:SAM-dependent methyltransferase, partial [Actinoplanes sp. NPDC051470]|uniref:SAM-dependent methyltransferase n=1 Tax=Actinoplanes sp. NPDC051470 TaxID=3157224 RepID=UPI003422D8B3